MKALSLRCLSSSSRNHFVGFRSDKGLEKTWFSFKNYAGFSRVLWLNCIYPASFRMRSTIKTYFPGFLQASLLPYIVTFQILCSVFKVQSPTSIEVRYEISTPVEISYPASIRCLVGPSGLEPPTLRLSVVRSSQLSYGPSSSQSPPSSVSGFAENFSRSLAPPLQITNASLVCDLSLDGGYAIFSWWR